ncbi:MAG: DNA-binding protein [Bacteroidales bacterium]|jgi:hypothetical protein|nr:DNA-binding protein [Bacteroidales bacterium]
MKKVKAIIERGESGIYIITLAEDYGLSYALLGDGETVEDAKNDFMQCYNEMKEYYNEAGKKFTELDITFEFEMAAFLAAFSGKLSLSGLQNITGIHQKQLSHYLHGVRRPKGSTVQKVNTALFNFRKDLERVHLV